MIAVCFIAVPLAGIITAALVLLRQRLYPTPAPAPVSPESEPEPELITDPLHPDWRPDCEMIPPLFYQRATPAPPSWSWESFTQTWTRLPAHDE